MIVGPLDLSFFKTGITYNKKLYDYNYAYLTNIIEIC